MFNDNGEDSIKGLIISQKSLGHVQSDNFKNTLRKQ